MNVDFILVVTAVVLLAALLEVRQFRLTIQRRLEYVHGREKNAAYEWVRFLWADKPWRTDRAAEELNIWALKMLPSDGPHAEYLRKMMEDHTSKEEEPDGR